MRPQQLLRSEPAGRKLDQLIRAALAEDIGSGDITSELTVPARLTGQAAIVSHASGVLAGIKICGRVFSLLDRRLQFRALRQDGTAVAPDDKVALIQGPVRSLLAAERTALNFLCRLSGIATLTRRYVQAVAGTGAAIYDTRKTTPVWRFLEKYAVRCGGGHNHRFGLYDMVLAKDNHIAAAGSVTEALRRCQYARLPVEIEVKNLQELRQALAAGARLIMLDNMTLAQMRRAVELTAGRACLEASGSITLSRVARIARLGVDRISVGALTHSAPALNFSLELLQTDRPA